MNEYFKHIILESGIHHVIWMDNSQESVDAYSQLFFNVYQKTIQESSITPIAIRILSDFRLIAFPELKSTVSNTIDARRQNLIPNDNYICRLAYLSDDEELVSQVNHLGGLMPPTFKREFFKSNQEEQAIEWLLLDE